MRPTKLTIQGLTAYKQPVEIDFTDLDLFAITGPTGAGKSSLVDAITFALYGKAPRVGRSVKELISQGEERLKVTLEFTTNGDQYRIYRSTARKGQAPVQLEHFERERDEWVPEEVDRVRDTNAFIEELLQMDYEAFVRSVLLPQGQFQEFLAGDRDQRRKVLDGLLRLNVYGAMQQRANAIAADQTRKADDIRQRLDTEMADATPDALKAAKADLKQLKAHAAELAKTRAATDAACRTADALSDARRREREARAKSTTSRTRRWRRRRSCSTGGNLLLAGLDARIVAVATEIKAAEYDGDLHLRLTKCLPLLKQIETRSRAGSEADPPKSRRKSRDVEKLRAEVAAAKQKRDAARASRRTREQDEYEAARHTNAAVLLRQGLAKGDPCPVCGQHVGALPEGKHLALDKIKAAHDKAKADETPRTTRRCGRGEASRGRRGATQSRWTEQLAELREPATRLARERPSASHRRAWPECERCRKAHRRAGKGEDAARTLEAKQQALADERQAEEKRIAEARTGVASSRPRRRRTRPKPLAPRKTPLPRRSRSAKPPSRWRGTTSRPRSTPGETSRTLLRGAPDRRRARRLASTRRSAPPASRSSRSPRTSRKRRRCASRRRPAARRRRWPATSPRCCGRTASRRSCASER